MMSQLYAGCDSKYTPNKATCINGVNLQKLKELQTMCIHNSNNYNNNNAKNCHFVPICFFHFLLALLFCFSVK